MLCLFTSQIRPFYAGTCKMRNETRNEIYRNETKSMRNEINRNEIDRNETKRYNTNEIKPILTKQFLGERQDKNSMKKIEKVSFKRRKR